MIEAMAHGKGVTRARAVCDDCGRDEVVACTYIKPHGPHSHYVPKESQARAKVIGMGWAYVKAKLRCPACEAKRKVVKMADVKRKAEVTAKEQPKGPTDEQYRKINRVLFQCYDLDNGRYYEGDSDDTVAQMVGVLPAWVAEIRDKGFGPNGGDERIDELEAEVKEWKEKATDQMNAYFEEVEALRKVMADGTVVLAKLDKIKGALSNRVIKKAGV